MTENKCLIDTDIEKWTFKYRLELLPPDVFKLE